MVKWTEVNAYSGMPVEEDAPTNATGAAVSTDVPIVKKKKKTFLDARTKAYKEHQKRLEASRQRREERKISKFDRESSKVCNKPCVHFFRSWRSSFIFFSSFSSNFDSKAQISAKQKSPPYILLREINF